MSNLSRPDAGMTDKPTPITEDAERELRALLPCPFCGGAFRAAQEPRDNYPMAGMWYVFHARESAASRLCPIEVQPHYGSEAEAIDALNFRPALLAALDEARARADRAEADERAGVANWLRGQAAAGEKACVSALEGSKLEHALASGVVALRRAADAIVAGQHRERGE